VIVVKQFVWPEIRLEVETIAAWKVRWGFQRAAPLPVVPRVSELGDVCAK